MCDASSQRSIPKELFSTLFIVLVAAVLWQPRLTAPVLRHWDEAWYAQVTRETSAEPNWLTLRWNYQPWFHKPPLYFWTSAVFIKVFGESEVTARLTAFAFGLSCVGLIAWFVSHRFGPPAGALAGAVLIAIPEFSRYATRGQLDVPIAFWITVQLLCFWKGRPKAVDDDRHEATVWWHLAGGVAFGLALMTKGAAAGLAVVVQLVYIAVSREFHLLKSVRWWGAILLGLAIAAPWHVYQWRLHGDQFVLAYFNRHLGQFFGHIYPEVHYERAKATYYLHFLIVREWVWGWTILALAGWGAVDWLKRRDRFVLFALCWVTAIPASLSFAHTKWSWYLVPLYPGAALLACALVARTGWWTARKSMIGAAALLVVVASASEPFWRPATTEFEEHLKKLAPTLQAHVPPSVPIHTVQDGKASSSIYPIATLYYCQRPVQVSHSVDQFVDVARRSVALFHVFVHEKHVDAVVKQGRAHVDGKWYDVEIADRSGPVRLLRIVPGYLADQIRAVKR